MSRRRSADGPRRPAEVVILCRGCDDGHAVARVHLDDDGDPAIWPPTVPVEYSYVDELGARGPGEPLGDGIPRRLVLRCDRGHILRVSVGPLLKKLETPGAGRMNLTL